MTDKLFNEEDLEGLPTEIRKQAEEAEKLQESLQEEPEADDPSDQDGEETPEVPEEPETPETEPVEPEPKQEDFEHKYKVLQGMIRKKDDDIRSLSSDIERLRQDLDRANKIIDERSEEHPETIEETGSLDPEEFEDYGSEMKNLVNAFNQLMEENKVLKQKIDNPTVSKEVQAKVENIEQRQAKTEKQKFLEALDGAVPDWEKINNDTEFHAFLMEEDPFSGVRRQDLLAKAEANLDIGRVSNFFKVFKDISNPGQETKPKPKEKGLESEIVPDKTGAAPVGNATQKKITPEQLDKASKDFGRGLITEDAYNKIEKRYINQLGG